MTRGLQVPYVHVSARHATRTHCCQRSPKSTQTVKRHTKLEGNATLNWTGGCYDNWECRPARGEAGLRVWGCGE